MNTYTTTETLSEKQKQELKDFFQIDNAQGHSQTLLNIYHGYLASGQLNHLPSEEISGNFYILKKIIRLIQVMEETPALEIKKPLPVHQN